MRTFAYNLKDMEYSSSDIKNNINNGFVSSKKKIQGCITSGGMKVNAYWSAWEDKV